MTGLEPATSGVTGRHSNRLSYTRALDVGAGRRVVGGELRGSMGGVKRHRRDNRQTLSSIFRCPQNPAFRRLHLPLRHAFELADHRRTAYWSARLGRLAQLVERFVYTEDVGGSSPSSPTKLPRINAVVFGREARERNSRQWQTSNSRCLPMSGAFASPVLKAHVPNSTLYASEVGRIKSQSGIPRCPH